MWRRTYEHSCDKVCEAERFNDEAFLIQAENLLICIGRAKRGGTF